MSWKQNMEANVKKARCPQGGQHVYPEVKVERPACVKCGKAKPKG